MPRMEWLCAQHEGLNKWIDERSAKFALDRESPIQGEHTRDAVPARGADRIDSMLAKHGAEPRRRIAQAHPSAAISTYGCVRIARWHETRRERQQNRVQTHR
jgi:hypothetical protein